MQGVRGGEHLPEPAPKEQMQGVRGGEYLPQHQRIRSQCKECQEADELMPDGLKELGEDADGGGGAGGDGQHAP